MLTVKNGNKFFIENGELYERLGMTARSHTRHVRKANGIDYLLAAKQCLDCALAVSSEEGRRDIQRTVDNIKTQIDSLSSGGGDY